MVLVAVVQSTKYLSFYGQLCSFILHEMQPGLRKVRDNARASFNMIDLMNSVQDRFGSLLTS